MGKTGDLSGTARRAALLGALLDRCSREEREALRGLLEGEMARLDGEGKRYVSPAGAGTDRQRMEGLLREYGRMGETENQRILRGLLEKRQKNNLPKNREVTGSGNLT